MVLIVRTLSLHPGSELTRQARLRRLAVAGALLCTLLCTVAAGATALHHPPFGPAAARTITLPVGREPEALGLDERSGHIFVANYLDGTISVLDARKGTLLSTIPLGHYPLDLVVDQTTARVFAINMAAAATPLTSPPAAVASVSMLDARTGALLRTELPGLQPSALAVDERHDRVFVLNSGAGTLNLLDARSGGVVATVALDGIAQTLDVDSMAGRVYVGTAGVPGRLLVLDSGTGRRLRSLTVGRSVAAVLAVPAAGRVLVAGDGMLRLLDARSGVLRRTVRAAVVPLRAVPGSARVLVTGAGGLRLLDARTGRWAGPWVLEGAALSPVWGEDVASDPTTRQLVVAVQPAGAVTGELAVLDGHSGQVLRLIPAGAEPSALAFDARTRRAIVLLPDGAPSSQGAGPLAGVMAWGRRWLPWLPLPQTPTASAGGSVRLIALR